MSERLAVQGGKPVVPREMLSYKPLEPVMTGEDIQAAEEVLRSGKYLGSPGAPQMSALQEEWAKYVGTKYCIALNSGTAALHAAVAAAGIGPGDEVITSPFSFLSSATSVIFQNGIPVFVDIDPRTYTLDPKKIEEKITDRTRAIMPVHIAGLPADMDEINEIAKKHNLIVIEDACQAHGVEYKGKKTGNLGDMGTFSLQRSKNLTTGADGGLLTTNNEELCRKAEMIGRFGEIPKEGKKRDYNAYSLGWMYRTDEILMAIARSRFKRLDEDNKLRQTNCRYLTENLSQIKSIIPPYVPGDRTHVYYLYVIRFNPKELGLDVPPREFRERIEKALQAEGVLIGQWQVMPLFHTNLFKLKEGYGKGCPWSCPHARKVEYKDEDYPETLKLFEDYTTIWGIESPHGLKLMEYYVEAFRKVFKNLGQIF